MMGLFRVLSGLVVLLGVGAIVIESPFGSAAEVTSSYDPRPASTRSILLVRGTPPPLLVFYLVDSQIQVDVIATSEATIHESVTGSGELAPNRVFYVLFARNEEEELAAGAAMLEVIRTKHRGSIIAIEDVRDKPASQGGVMAPR